MLDSRARSQKKPREPAANEATARFASVDFTGMR
jgi:hypothetical protein